MQLQQVNRLRVQVLQAALDEGVRFRAIVALGVAGSRRPALVAM